MNPFEQIAAQIGEVVKRALIISYTMQGHKLTSGLINSIEYQVRAQVTSAEIDFLMFDYGVILDKGVSAARIPYSPGSGAKTSKYIDGLKQYARLRMGAATEKEAERIAFAIARKHKKEGMPTKASFVYSQTGKRTGAIDAALEDSNAEVTRLINMAMEEYIETFFITAMKRV